MAGLLNGGLDKPPSRLATSAIRVLIGPTLKKTKAGGLQLFGIMFLKSTFDLIPPTIPQFELVKSWKSPGDVGRLEVFAVACRFGPG